MCSANVILRFKSSLSLIIIRLFRKLPALKPLKVAYCTEMMGLIGAGNNTMVGMTVAVAVAIEEASK